MTKEILERAQDLKYGIDLMTRAIQRVHPYRGERISIRLYKKNGCGSDNGELLIEWNNDDDMCAAMEDVFRRHRDQLEEEFANLRGDETREEVDKMYEEEPVSLLSRLWRKWKRPC